MRTAAAAGSATVHELNLLTVVKTTGWERRAAYAWLRSLKAGDPAAFDALQAAEKRVWQATLRSYESRKGITQEKVQARLTRILAEGWAFNVHSEATFCDLMLSFVQQVRPVVINTC